MFQMPSVLRARQSTCYFPRSVLAYAVHRDARAVQASTVAEYAYGGRVGPRRHLHVVPFREPEDRVDSHNCKVTSPRMWAIVILDDDAVLPDVNLSVSTIRRAERDAGGDVI